MLRLAAPPSWAPKTWRPALGQALTHNFKVVVTDSTGAPVDGALVTAGEATAYTDSAGIATFSISSRAVHVTAKVGEYSVAKTVQWESPDIPAYLSFPVRIQPDIVRTAELAAFVAGVGLIGAGYIWKLDPLKIVGELVTGAIVFAMIYRLAGR